MKRDYIITTTFEDKTYKPVIRKSMEAVSRYANDQYSKFYRKYKQRADVGLTVEFGTFDDNLNYIRLGTYHA